MALDMVLTDIWKNGMQVAKLSGYTFTSECMYNAVFGNGITKNYYNDSAIFKTIISISKFKNEINRHISEYKLTGKKYFAGTLEITTSDNADVYYSLQHIDYTATVQSNGNMLVKITDYYNFDSIRKGISLGNFGNNLGYVMENLNLITPFNIVIQGYVWAGFPNSNEYEVNRYTEYGTCYPQTTINFRSTPNAESSSNIIGQYYVGESVNYDLVVITNKYAYISWISASSGTRRYMAVRDVITGERWTTIV